MKQRLIVILSLAALWLLLTGAPDASNLALGLVMGAVISYLMPPSARHSRHRVHPGAVLVLIPVFVWNVLRASVEVAINILTPDRRLHPAIIDVPLDATSELQTTLIANMISLTPGTLTLDHDESGTRLFVHVMHVPNEDVDVARAKIRDQIEAPLLRALSTRN